VIRPPHKVVTAAARSDSEPSTAPVTDTESVASSGTVTPVPALHPSRTARQQLCPRLLGNRLRTKQGRRTKQRLDNERMLMVMYGVDDEELEGCDIAPQTRSHFLDLMSSGVLLTLAGGSNCNAVHVGVHCSENEALLEEFINNEEEKFFHKEKRGRKRKQSQEGFQPEEAFMKIGFNMRQALKKHPPMGMLENIEEKLNERFSENPNTEFLSDEMSSFERLLLHALAAYNALNSHSFEFGGKRVVRVENPHSTWFRRDPGLCEYLARRFPCSKYGDC